MIATCNDHILLGRNVKWPAGRYSALAGFVEIGESLEEAACREVLEESGVKVSDPKNSPALWSILFTSLPILDDLLQGHPGLCVAQTSFVYIVLHGCHDVADFIR